MEAPLPTAPPAAASDMESTALPHINGTAIGRQWPRDRWLEAIWESDMLTANERCVAYVYGRYAGRSDISWCLWDELRKRTGIKSRDAIHRAVKGLMKAGWLVLAEAARQHYSARYRLTIPSQGSGRRTSETTGRQSSSPGDGHLEASPGPPVVRETDIPVVRETKPVVRETDPSTQTESSDLQPGCTLPPDPLRTERPQAVTRDDQTERLTAVPDLNDTKQVTSRTRTRGTTVTTHQMPMLSVIDGELPDHPVDDYQLTLPVTIPPPPPNRIRDEVLPALAAQLAEINARVVNGTSP